MRGVLVRNVGFGIIALALTVFAGCNDDPLSFDVKDSEAIFVDPSSMVLAAGRSATISSRTVNQGLEPTYEEISAAQDASCGSASVSIVTLTDTEPATPPGTFAVTAGTTAGETCVVLTSSSGLTTTVEITVVADAIEVVSTGSPLRAGSAGTIVARLIDLGGNEVGPYDPTVMIWSSDNSSIADVSAGDGSYTTSEAGSAEITLSWPGQAENGTADLGVTIETSTVIEVQGDVPANAYYAVTGDSTTILGAAPVDSTQNFVVTVEDAFGNVNTLPDEIISVSLDPVDPAITATAEIKTDDPLYGAGDVPVVTLTTVGPGGTYPVNGFVTTSEGDLAFEGIFTVLAPSITAITPDNGGFAETATITGTGLSATGATTLVWVDGERLGNFTVVSDTEIEAQMPTYADPGTHSVVVEVGGILTTEAITWEQTNSCVAQDFPDEPGFDGPFVFVSLPLECNGTLAGPQDDWFWFDISEDALGGETEIGVTLAPQWTAVKDIDWYYSTSGFSFTFLIDELPATATVDLGADSHIFVADDYAGFNGDNTPQPYTAIATIDTN